MPTEEYWGYLIKEDKSPAPIFEQLLLGIANYIVCFPLPMKFALLVRKLTRLHDRMDKSRLGTPSA